MLEAAQQQGPLPSDLMILALAAATLYIYAPAINTTLWRALACNGLAVLGAGLLVSSDSLIGIERIASPFAAALHLIILACWLDQWAIASSVGHRSTDKVLTQSGARSIESC
ncbi:hypothetical protein FGL97_00510 [Pseudomonas putida]|nr:hypothetical protein [Pseudomonas putida]NVN66736.1 hypothetical protein [Pseudomonas putida]